MIRFTGLVAMMVALTCAVEAYGQRGRRPPTAGQVPRYTPSSPTVSPYLNLLGRNGGPAQNYFGLVRPLQNQRAINERQSNLSASNQLAIQGLRDQNDAFSQPDIKPTGTAGWFQTLGANPRHQVSSHFFGQWGTGPGRAAARR
jgi:hypothetical protein